MPDHAPTLFERRLQRALASASGPDVDAFWRAWQARGGEPIHDLQGFRTACADLRSTRRLPQDLMSVVGELGAAAPGSPLHELAPALLLAAAERYLLMQPARGALGADGCMRITVRDVLAAGLLAAAEFNTGLRVVRDAQTGQRVPGNVLAGARLSELGHRSVDAVHRAALLAAADGGFGREGLGARIQRMDGYLADGVPGDDVVHDALDALEKSEGVRLMFALPAGSRAPLVADAALRQRMQQAFGVPTWVHDVPPPALADDDPRAQTQGTLMRWLKGVLDTLDPLGPAAPGAPSHQAPMVFVSYAHADDGGAGSDDGVRWAQDRVAVHLRPLERQGRIRLWMDTRGIRPGDTWRREIADAIRDCQVAVLLVSAHFLGSEFVQQHELPPLRQRHQAGELLLLPVLLKECDWQGHDWLEALQFATGGQPLQGSAHDAVNEVLAKLAAHIRTHCVSVPTAKAAP